MFSLERNWTAWNKRNDKAMSLKFRRKWERFLLYSERMVRGKACFTVNTVMIKTIRQTQCPLHIAVVLYFS